MLLNLLNGYGQRQVAIELRDLTLFRMPLGLLCHVLSLQGTTNTFGDYQRVITHIMKDEVPTQVGVFLNNLVVKASRDLYGKEVLEDNAGIQCFMSEHLVVVEMILFA